MLTGLSKIDLEYKLLMGEGVIFATIFLLLPLWLLIYPRLAFYGVGMDMAVLVILSMICAVCDRRVDVFLYSPMYFVALRGLLGFPVQLLESGGSEETGQRLVCGQAI